MSMSIGLGIGLGKQRGGSTLPETHALVARMTTKPSATRIALIDNVIRAIKATGAWSLSDALYVTAAHDTQAAKLNWIDDAYNLTAVASPTFVADRGYTGDGSSSYLDTGFNPTTAPSPKFTQNDATMLMWSRTNLSQASDHSGDFGQSSATVNSRIGRTLGTSGGAIGRANMSATYAPLATGAYPGMVSWSRTGASAWSSYAQGVASVSGADASAALSSGTFRLLAWTAGAFGVNQIAAASIGGSLNATQHAAVYAALYAYLSAIGAA